MDRTRDEKKEIANEILRQLGGYKFVAMTGARDILALDSGLRFRLPGGGGFTKNGINLVSIFLAPSDTYSVEFFKTWKAKCGWVCKPISQYNEIYNDQL